MTEILDPHAEMADFSAALVERLLREDTPSPLNDDEARAIAESALAYDATEIDGLQAGHTSMGQNLPEAFWAGRPILQQIRRAAHSRSRAGDVVLAGVLVRTAVMVPPTIKLPAIVESAATVDLLVAGVARSGGGKSSGYRVAAELLPINDPEVVLDLPPGSGEGLIDAYLGMVAEDVDGKKVKVRGRGVPSACGILLCGAHLQRDHVRQAHQPFVEGSEDSPLLRSSSTRATRADSRRSAVRRRRSARTRRTRTEASTPAETGRPADRGGPHAVPRPLHSYFVTSSSPRPPERGRSR